MSHNMYQYNVIYAFYNFIFTHIISTKNPNYIYIYHIEVSLLLRNAPECREVCCSGFGLHLGVGLQCAACSIRVQFEPSG